MSSYRKEAVLCSGNSSLHAIHVLPMFPILHLLSGKGSGESLSVLQSSAFVWKPLKSPWQLTICFHRESMYMNMSLLPGLAALQTIWPSRCSFTVHYSRRTPCHGVRIPRPYLRPEFFFVAPPLFIFSQTNDTSELTSIKLSKGPVTSQYISPGPRQNTSGPFLPRIPRDRE
jgi:hypothetical protein